MKYFFYTSMLLLCLSSCSMPVSTRLTHSELAANQSVTFLDGHSVIISSGDSTNVALVAEQLGRDLTLTVVCTNKKGQPKLIQPTLIRVFSLDLNNVFSECKVYSDEEYLAFLEKQTRRTSIFLAVAGGLEEVAASQPTTTTTQVKVSEAGSYTSETYNVKTVTSANPVAVQQVRNNNLNAQQELMNAARKEQAAVKELLLKKHTLEAGERKVGEVMVRSKVEKCRLFKVVIPFGNEEHEFILKPETAK